MPRSEFAQFSCRYIKKTNREPNEIDISPPKSPLWPPMPLRFSWWLHCGCYMACATSGQIERARRLGVAWRRNWKESRYRGMYMMMWHSDMRIEFARYIVRVMMVCQCLFWYYSLANEVVCTTILKWDMGMKINESSSRMRLWSLSSNLWMGRGWQRTAGNGLGLFISSSAFFSKKWAYWRDRLSSSIMDNYKSLDLSTYLLPLHM